MSEQFKRQSATRWVSKYALTRGVVQVDGHYFTPLPGEQAGKYFYTGDKRVDAIYGPMDHHNTREEALIRAEQMRQAKIKSLQKQLDRLNKLEF